jgi:peptidoglycan hydrolase CwlO-like protein
MEHDRFIALERQLLVSLTAQTERDQRIVQMTDELALKSSLLEQAEANAAETAKRAALESREHPLMQTPVAKPGDLVEGLPLSRNQQISQYEKKLANVRAELEAKESELETIRLRLTDAEKGWTKSKAEADALRAQIAECLVSMDEDRVMSRLTERMRAMVGAEMASLRGNEKSRESI